MINSAFVSVETFPSEEFERLMAELPPSDPNTYELIHGRILMTSPPGWPHGLYESRVVAALTNFLMARNLGLVFGSSRGFRLTDEDTVAPDVAFVSHERWAAGPPPVMGKHLHVTPDLAVEILSPTRIKRDKDLSARCGVNSECSIGPG